MAALAGPRSFAYLDLDVDGHRARLSRAAMFVHATDMRHGWSSKDLRLLGGSEFQRLPEAYASDHDWAGRGALALRPPACGCRVVLELFPAAAPLGTSLAGVPISCNALATHVPSPHAAANLPMGPSGACRLASLFLGVCMISEPLLSLACAVG